MTGGPTEQHFDNCGMERKGGVNKSRDGSVTYKFLKDKNYSKTQEEVGARM